MRRALAATTLLLALLGIALSIEHLLDSDHYNPGFVEHPLIIQSHVVLGGLYLALALPQLAASIRRRRPRLHRVLGRTAVAAGLSRVSRLCSSRCSSRTPDRWRSPSSDRSPAASS